MATALVTGGAGYIGSHACVERLAAGWNVVVVDNVSNSSEVALDRVRELAAGNLWFHQVDLLDEAGLDRVLDAHPVDAVVHFAGLKAPFSSPEEASAQLEEAAAHYRSHAAAACDLASESFGSDRVLSLLLEEASAVRA